jgi:AmiR/NasT family two-component response regulator
MTTSVNTPESIFASFRNQCEGYLTKPITRARLLEHLTLLGLATT